MIHIESRFDEIYRKYYPVLLRFVASRHLPQVSAEDVAHETLALLWQKRDECSFEDDAPLMTWLLRTAKLIAVSHARKRQEEESLSDHENTASDGDPVQQHMENVQLEQYVHQIEQELSERDKRLFNLIFVERRSYNECAAELNVKAGTLRSSISRLRERLRPYINKLINDE